MSRVHDALRRAEQSGELNNIGMQPEPLLDTADPILEYPGSYIDLASTGRGSVIQDIEFEGFLSKIKEIPFSVAPESLLIDLDRLHEMPGEEFRSLRTRLNHIQTQQHVHSLVVTSASPAEGK